FLSLPAGDCGPVSFSWRSGELVVSLLFLPNGGRPAFPPFKCRRPERSGEGRNLWRVATAHLGAARLAGGDHRRGPRRAPFRAPLLELGSPQAGPVLLLPLEQVDRVTRLVAVVDAPLRDHHVEAVGLRVDHRGADAA